MFLKDASRFQIWILETLFNVEYVVAFLVGHPGLRSAWIDITSERAGDDEDQVVDMAERPWKPKLQAEIDRWKHLPEILEPLRTVKRKEGIRISWEDWGCEYLETSRHNASNWAFMEQLNSDMAKASARGQAAWPARPDYVEYWEAGGTLMGRFKNSFFLSP